MVTMLSFFGRRCVRLTLLALTGAMVALTGVSQKKKSEVDVLKVRDILVPAPYGSVHIEGFLGSKLDLCINNRVMAQDIDRVVAPFKDTKVKINGKAVIFSGYGYLSLLIFAISISIISIGESMLLIIWSVPEFPVYIR